MKPSIYYPVKPFHVNQAFGENNPCVKNFGLPSQSIVDSDENNVCPSGYTKLYEAFGMKGHDGTDLQAGIQDVYAAMDGTVIEMQTNAARGLGLGIISPEPLDLGVHGTHYLKLRYWHLKSFNVSVGQSVKVGDVLGISDNTGYSAGNHLHFEGDPMDKDAAGNYVWTSPQNGYLGAIDIAPFFNGEYAQDYMIKMQAAALVQVVNKINPASPQAPVEESLVQKIIDLIKQELSL